jgi:DNA-directed RNA polymerase subunit RPC12/RpoP
MEKTIEHLQELFKARIALDEQIKTALGFFEAVSTTEKEMKRSKPKKQYKKREPKKEKTKRYNCEECDLTFDSGEKDYLKVRCPECQSKRVLSLG